MRIKNSVGNEVVIDKWANGDIEYSEYNNNGNIVLHIYKNIQTVWEYDSRGVTKIMQRDLSKLNNFYFNKIIVKRRFSEQLKGTMVYGSGDGNSEISFRGNNYLCYRNIEFLENIDSKLVENIEELKRVSTLANGNSDKWNEVYSFSTGGTGYCFYEMKLDNGEILRFFCETDKQHDGWEYEEFEEGAVC